MKLRVYIACPYTLVNQNRYVRNSIHAAELVVKLGGLPFIPLLNHFWDMVCPHPYDFWLNYSIKWLEVCHIFFRIPGESKGADIEEEIAKRHGLTICRTVEELEKALNVR